MRDNTKMFIVELSPYKIFDFIRFSESSFKMMDKVFISS